MTLLELFDLLRLLLLLSAFLLVLFGRRAVLVGGRVVESGPDETWPTVALIVPATGNPPSLASCVRSLLQQEYPSFQLLFVTRDPEDEANAVILMEIAGSSKARLLHSGRSRLCGQKNQNLLAGIRAVGNQAEILAFSDSTRIAPPSWLMGLVSPIVSGEKEATSGYHHVIPQEQSVAAAGHACSVLLLFLTKGIGPMNQPWGGGTAIRRELFESLGVGAIWAGNVVDDVSLAACLKRKRIPVAMSPGSCLVTLLAGETIRAWNRWLIRQWMYLKLCFPAAWAVAGLYCALMSLSILLSLGAAVAGALGFTAPGAAVSSLLFLLLLAVMGGLLRPLHPSPGFRFYWLPGFFFTILLGAWSHLQTLFARTLLWKGVRYRVGWGGVVLGAREEAVNPGRNVS